LSADPLQKADEYLGGWWYGNRSWSDNMSNIFGRIAASIESGITAPFESIDEIYDNGGITGLLSAYAGKIKNDVMKSLKSWSAMNLLANAGSVVLNGLKNAGSWLIDMITGKDGLATENPEFHYTPEQIAKMDNAERERLFREIQEKQREAEKVKKSQSENHKAVMTILDKQKKGEPITKDDIVNLTKTMIQNGDSPTLPAELLDAISDDPEAFKKLFNKVINFGKDGKVKFDINNAADMQKFANNLSHVFCKIISTYSQLVANGIENTPTSIGDFFKLSLEKGWIKPETPARQSAEIQTIVDELAGAGKYKVMFFGKDKDTNGAGLMQMLADTAMTNQEIKLFTLYINSPHGMSVYNNEGNPVVVDSSWRGFNFPFELIQPSTVTGFWYLVRQEKRRGK
jgi:hypothetical protein